MTEKVALKDLQLDTTNGQFSIGYESGSTLKGKFDDINSFKDKKQLTNCSDSNTEVSGSSHGWSSG